MILIRRRVYIFWWQRSRLACDFSRYLGPRRIREPTAVHPDAPARIAGRLAKKNAALIKCGTLLEKNRNYQATSGGAGRM
jgi:hypothetical protein